MKKSRKKFSSFYTLRQMKRKLKAEYKLQIRMGVMISTYFLSCKYIMKNKRDV